MLLIGLPSWSTLLLNVSLLFGFANAGSASMIMGGWSIGVELVFYVTFPLILIMTNRRLIALSSLAGAGIVLLITFLQNTLSGHQQMTASLWQSYTQPIAFFGYFAFGCFTAELYIRYQSTLKGHPGWVLAIVLASVPFFLIQVEHDVDLLIGWKGILLIGSTMIIITSVAFAKEPRGVVLRLAHWLGKLSYPIYLLHPLVYNGIVSPITDGVVVRITLTVSATFALSALVHYFVEQPFLRPQRLRTST